MSDITSQLADDESLAALTAALIDIERYVGRDQWDQPARLFSLVFTDDVIAADPDLAHQLGLRGSAAGAPQGALTSIEQSDFHAGENLEDTLIAIGWPHTVQGCALCLERTFLPASAEAELPADPHDAAQFVATHPQRQEVRLIAGVMRCGKTTVKQTVCRIRAENELITSPDLTPGLVELLSQTLLQPLDNPSQIDLDGKECTDEPH